MAGLQGTATNTLTGEDVLGNLEAQAQEYYNALAQRTADTRQAAQQAQQNVLAATQAPQEAPNDFVSNLFSNLASVVSQQPSYRENRQEVSAQNKADLLKKRADNLSALMEVYRQKADEAQKADDRETTEKYRTKLETTSKTFDLVNSNADRAARAAENALDRASAERIAAEKATQAKNKEKAAEGDYFDSLTNQTRGGTKWLDLSNVKGVKPTNAALQYAKDNGLVAVDKGVADRLRTSEEVQSNLDDIERVVANFLPETPQGRAVSIPKNLLAAWTQSNPDIASFGNTYAAAIRNIQALAGGQGSGFRLTNAEVAMATRNFPKITDDLPTAMRKLKWERDFLANKERTHLQRNMTVPKEGGPSGTQAPIKTTGVLVNMIDDKGKPRTIDQAEVADAISKGGWKRAPAK